MIDTLIDKEDNFEIVRDQIAQILANEVLNQMALAVIAEEDETLWDLKIYTERSNPWELWLNDNTEKIPIVNVWFDNSNIDGLASNTVERQKTRGTYNIDIYARGITEDDISGGHVAGDEDSAKEVQRAARLVRNILMSATYIYLELRGTVSKRWTQSITAFQPEQSGNQMQRVQAIRIAFVVDFNEFSPQVNGEALELVTNEIKRAEDGSVIAGANFEYT